METSTKANGKTAASRKLADDCDCPDDDFDDHVRWATTAWPIIDPDVEAIVCRVEMAQRHFERAAVDTRDALELAPGELKILLRLARGARSQGEIAKSLLVSTGTMTNQLDKLEAAGRIVRLPDPNDRRGKLVEMTAKGHEALDTYINVQAQRERQLTSKLSPEDRRLLSDLLRKLLASVAEDPATTHK
ncbi:MAG TPA: MarR family transcriptional regulator [Acidimicrobiales bacterium]|jgi:DNA-binding MarR family transcriptional regulator|nr:MarR family transcriptional regulator [Acidimicrobiales bacterium]